MALACDVQIAAQDAQLGAIWVRRGIPPESAGAYLLTQLVGPAKACELIFTGRMVEAGEAEAIGLVNQVVPAGRAVEAAREMARNMAENAPVAIAMAKMMTYQALETSLQVHGRLDFLGQEFCFNTADREEEHTVSSSRSAPPPTSGVASRVAGAGTARASHEAQLIVARAAACSRLYPGGRDLGGDGRTRGEHASLPACLALRPRPGAATPAPAIPGRWWRPTWTRVCASCWPKARQPPDRENP